MNTFTRRCSKFTIFYLNVYGGVATHFVSPTTSESCPKRKKEFFFHLYTGQEAQCSYLNSVIIISIISITIIEMTISRALLMAAARNIHFSLPGLFFFFLFFFFKWKAKEILCFFFSFFLLF